MEYLSLEYAVKAHDFIIDDIRELSGIRNVDQLDIKTPLAKKSYLAYTGIEP